MSKVRLWKAVGLMSGTSADGIDAALIATDGEAVVERGPALSIPYNADFRARLLAAFGGWERTAEIVALEQELTRLHADAVMRLLDQAKVETASVDVVGFHGQTLAHDPAGGRTWQLGDGGALADRLGLDVIYDFRAADVAEGGQGAPLAPAYHQALAAGLDQPLAVINIGGVANISFLVNGADPLAFDTGAGNGLIDDWTRKRTDQPYDADGVLASVGRIDEDRLSRWLSDPYFGRRPPKSLDRNDFSPLDMEGLSTEDGAATLTAFTARSVALARSHLPASPRRWLVSGGGRHNPTLMRDLTAALDAPVGAVEQVGWDGDAIEAQAFAYLAVRSRRGLPLTFPGTTGVDRPVGGGRLARPAGRDQAISASLSLR